MIAKAKSISHGINAIRYMSGESENKKHPEKIYHVYNQFLSDDMDAMGMWTMMNFASMRKPNVKNNVIRLEISPSKEHTKDFSMSDWRNLWNEFVHEFDNLEIHDANGKLVSGKTNLSDSMATVWLHMESKSATPHLHAAVCRVDQNGRVNNDHAIHLRAQRAAEIIARRYGWTTAGEIRDNNLRKVSDDCMDILRLMPRWSWNEYASLLKSRGYDVRLRRDKERVVRGYVLAKGNAKYKASELGYGRKLTAKNIENTWKLLHPQRKTTPISMPPNPKTSGRASVGSSVMSSYATENRTIGSKNSAYTSHVIYDDYKERTPETSRVGIDLGGEHYNRFIPKEVVSYFDDEFDYRSVANWKELTNLATAYFAMLATPNVSVSGGGGSNGNDLKWGRDPREDEMEWARRCALAAIQSLGKRPRYGRRR